jgi:hypothetical protein
MKHVMIDIETFGQGPRAAIISIGAVRFDPGALISEQTLDTFSCNIGLKSAMKYGQVDADTLTWWMGDARAEAREHLDLVNGLDVPVALDAFEQWYRGDFSDRPTAAWSNGATFDLVIMRHAFEMAFVECPWKFFEERCFRTIKNLKKGIVKMSETGTAHKALDDAQNQTNWLLAIRDNLELVLA